MGSIADGMVDGSVCEECGAVFGDAPGYPRRCSVCVREYAGDEFSFANDITFEECRCVAAAHNYILRKHTEYHYSIAPLHRRWQLNIYPSTGRLYGDVNKPDAPPRLAIEKLTLRSVVNGVIAHNQNGRIPDA